LLRRYAGAHGHEQGHAAFGRRRRVQFTAFGGGRVARDERQEIVSYMMRSRPVLRCASRSSVP